MTDRMRIHKAKMRRILKALDKLDGKCIEYIPPGGRADSSPVATGLHFARHSPPSPPAAKAKPNPDRPRVYR